MPDDHLIELIKFLGKWGVKAICFGGGGEPTLHTKLAEAIKLTTSLGMEASVATNGILFNKDLLNSLILCRWVGISLDASTPATYRMGKKQDLFKTVLGNMNTLIKKVKRTKSNCDVAYKFLIFDYNQHEIYDACKLAKKIGARDFHVRPADYFHQGMGRKRKQVNYDINLILEQFEKCHLLESDNFRVFTVMHKFDDQLQTAKRFQ